MFTGLIESVGHIEEVKPTPAGFRLRVTTPLAAELRPGDSLAINGVCLTVISSDVDGLHADVSPETARVTTFGAARRGGTVNLERPLKAGSRLDGHFVQGHVDATGVVEELRQEGDSWWLTIAYPPTVGPFIVRKGSIAVDGISLTVAGLDDKRFDVQVIPYTWAHTNLQHTREGDSVNIECDILGKYVARAVEQLKS
jgi:riboflavin synthase